jgi:5-formyltetrahydrofolate cyclo-ligase
MGYYDRFLSRFPNACKIGICLENQWSEEPLVLQPHDILMDKIIIAN